MYWCFWTVVLEKTLESPLDCKEVQPVHPKGDQSWEGLMRSWNSNTLATSCEELTHWKRPWCWGRLRAGGEGDSRGWDGWMASPTQWTWVWVDSGSWWWTGRPGVLRFMGSQGVRHDWATELNWTELVYVFVTVLGLRGCSQAFSVTSEQEQGLLPSCGAHFFSLKWLLLLQSTGSRCMVFSSSDARA